MYAEVCRLIVPATVYLVVYVALHPLKVSHVNCQIFVCNFWGSQKSFFSPSDDSSDDSLLGFKTVVSRLIRIL